MIENALMTIENVNLLTALDDLSKFVLIGRDKLQAVKSEIKAMSKIKLAGEVVEQKRAEAQELAEVVLLAEAKVGELLNQLPKNGVGRPQKNIDTAVKNLDIEPEIVDAEIVYKVPAKTKADAVAELGFTQKQAEHLSLFLHFT